MNCRVFVVLIGAGIAVVSLWPRSVPWAGAVSLAAPYPPLNQDARPALIRTSQLPELTGYQSPKPVVAADGDGNVVVVAQGNANNQLRSDMLVWRSVDRGESWEPPKNLTEKTSEGELCFDPWLETDGHGHYYFVHGFFPDGRPLIRRSKDAGKTWLDSLPIPWKSCDRPVLGISPDGKKLVVAGAMSERAPNSPTQPLNGDDPDLARKMRAMFRLSAGVFLSNNGGDTWVKWPSPFGDDEHAIPFAVVVDDSERVAASWIVEGNGSRSAVSLSGDLGRTWTTTTLVDPLQPDRPHPFNGERFPVLALDEGGSLHVAYVAAGGTGLMVRRSRDWKTWEVPFQLATSAAEEVRMAAIDGCGSMVHVTWLERIGKSWHAYYRGSRNFGDTWSAPCCLSQSIRQSDSSISSGFQIHSDDDQSSIRDDGCGRIHAVWCIRGGSIVHAVLDWSSKPGNAEIR